MSTGPDSHPYTELVSNFAGMGDALPLLGREILSRELQDFHQPVAVLCVKNVKSTAAGRSPLQLTTADHLSTFSSLNADMCTSAVPASALVRQGSGEGRTRLLFAGEQGGGGGISVGCVLTNAAAVGALQLKDEQVRRRGGGGSLLQAMGRGAVVVSNTR